MSAEDDNLSNKLEWLEIAAARPASSPREENPFRTGRRRHQSRRVQRMKMTVAFKGKTALDKSAVSHAIYCNSPVTEYKEPHESSPSSYIHPNKVKICKLKETKDVHSLIYDCSRLRISGEASHNNNNCHNSRSRSRGSRKECVDNDKTKESPSCSQQALNPPCDITIDELASYFETFVHIPRKMTLMAEMMYT